MDRAKVESIIELLRRHSDDASLVLRRINDGSVKLLIDGSRLGFEHLEFLIRTGQLTDLLGIPIKTLTPAEEIPASGEITDPGSAAKFELQRGRTSGETLESANVSSYRSEGPFDSIESAQEYMSILAATALEVMSDLKRDREAALREGAERRAQAIQLAIFKLKQLNANVYRSRRMLNDLRTIRRLILNERMNSERSLQNEGRA
jgi:hypothetical protein